MSRTSTTIAKLKQTRDTYLDQVHQLDDRIERLVKKEEQRKMKPVNPIGDIRNHLIKAMVIYRGEIGKNPALDQADANKILSMLEGKKVDVGKRVNHNGQQLSLEQLGLDCVHHSDGKRFFILNGTE